MDKLNKYEVEEIENGKLLVKGESISDRQVDAPVGDYMIINGAWYIDAIPNQIVVEKADGTLAKFRLTPFRKITESELTIYKSCHPRKCKGQPLPDYLYRFYGIKRNDESLTEVIRVRISPSDKERLDTAAKNEDKNASEFIRDVVRGL